MAKKMSERVELCPVVTILPSHGGLTAGAVEVVAAHPEIPVTWNLAIHDLDEEGLAALTGRLDRDSIAPMGYSGAPHPLLTLDEIRRDLRWAVSNPWSGGMGDRLGRQIHVLMPYGADPRRAAVRDLYRATAPQTVLGTLPGPDRRLVCYRPGGLVGFPYLPVHPHRDPVSGRGHRDERRLSRDLARALRRAGTETLVLHIFLDEDLSLLRRCLQLVSEQLRHSIVSASAGLQTATGAPLDLDASTVDPATAYPHLPTERNNWYRAAADRSRRASSGSSEEGDRTLAPESDESVRSRLLDLRPPGPGGARPPAAPPPADYGTDRTLGSSMQGNANVADEFIDVHLVGGRLSTITADGNHVAGAGTARSRLKVAGTTIEFDSWGAVSFEGERSRGLQEHLVLSAGYTPTPGSIIVEYFFVDGFSPLVMDLRVRYPVFESPVRIDESSPFEYPLFRIHEGQAVILETSYPDHTNTRTELDGPWEGVVYGQSFTFRVTDAEAAGRPSSAPALTMRAYDPDAQLIVGLPMALRPARAKAGGGRRRRGELELLLNPLGVYAPFSSDEISCIEEHLALLIAPGEQRAMAIPQAVKRELPGPWARERWE